METDIREMLEIIVVELGKIRKNVIREIPINGLDNIKRIDSIALAVEVALFNDKQKK